jgi:hypothetical protein
MTRGLRVFRSTTPSIRSTLSVFNSTFVLYDYARILIKTKGLRSFCFTARFDCIGCRIRYQECQSRSHFFGRIIGCYLYVSTPFIHFRA